jgi:alpha-beta hydrolase superfamily lysophospholipase
MIGSALPHCEGIKAFSETNQTDELQAITVPTLVMQGDDDQNVPYKDASPLQAKPLDRLQERRISRVVVQPLQIDNKQDIGGGGGSRTIQGVDNT